MAAACPPYGMCVYWGTLCGNGVVRWDIWVGFISPWCETSARLVSGSQLMTSSSFCSWVGEVNTVRAHIVVHIGMKSIVPCKKLFLNQEQNNFGLATFFFLCVCAILHQLLYHRGIAAFSLLISPHDSSCRHQVFGTQCQGLIDPH